MLNHRHTSPYYYNGFGGFGYGAGGFGGPGGFGGYGGYGGWWILWLILIVLALQSGKNDRKQIGTTPVLGTTTSPVLGAAACNCNNVVEGASQGNQCADNSLLVLLIIILLIAWAWSSGYGSGYPTYNAFGRFGRYIY